MPNTGEFDRRTANVPVDGKVRRPRLRSEGEPQIAVTALDYRGRVVTITSQQVEIARSRLTPPNAAFATSIYGGPLNELTWEASSWSASLRHHADAVNQVIEAIALDIGRGD